MGFSFITLSVEVDPEPEMGEPIDKDLKSVATILIGGLVGIYGEFYLQIHEREDV